MLKGLFKILNERIRRRMISEGGFEVGTLQRASFSECVVEDTVG
jgi:hypothetical protein